RAERIRLGEPRQHRAAEPGARQQIERASIAGAARGRESIRVLLGKALDLPQAEPQRRPRGVLSGLERCVPVARVDVDAAQLDALLAGVAHDLRRRVEAHGLAVEERRRKDRGIMALEPSRDIDQEREARGVRFRETVLAEALDLLEAALGKL